ncbi:hypothetical protein AB1Y20_004290 [Prymnesium parvum]
MRASRLTKLENSSVTVVARTSVSPGSWAQPTVLPSSAPSQQPPQEPSHQSSQQPSAQAFQQPSHQSSQQPSAQAFQQPSHQASQQPSHQASQQLSQQQLHAHAAPPILDVIPEAFDSSSSDQKSRTPVVLHKVSNLQVFDVWIEWLRQMFMEKEDPKKQYTRFLSCQGMTRVHDADPAQRCLVLAFQGD